MGFIGTRRRCHAGVDFALDERLDQVGPLREVPVQGADAGFGGDCPHRRVRALLGEYGQCRLKERVRVLARFRSEQPPYSILNRSIEREVLPACQRYGMGVMTWSPLAKGMLTGKYRKGAPTPDSLRAKFFPKAMSDAASPDAVEALIPLADSAGMSLMRLALGFVLTHPTVTSAIIGPRTMAQLDGLLAGAETVLDDALLDRIDEIVPPGVDVAPLEGAAHMPPSITQASLRRRPIAERMAA